MAYWSVAILTLLVSLWAYRHPPRTWVVWRLGRPRNQGRQVGLQNNEVDEIPNNEYNSPIGTTATTSISAEVLESENTPKAKAAKHDVAIPTLSLAADNGHDEISTSTTEKSVASTAVSFSPADDARALSNMAPPPKPISKPSTNPAIGLTPPPAHSPSGQGMPAAGVATSLRVPSTGPLPNRGPPANSQQRVWNGLSPNNTVHTPNPRGKVLLSPGHSPMDWAVLTRSGNLSGVNSFQRVTPSQLRSMTGRKGKPAWSSWQGKVYNITPYLPFHPGGEAEIMKAAGRDGMKLFMEVHPWVNWENMLGSCLVGVVVPEDYGRSPMEEQD